MIKGTHHTLAVRSQITKLNRSRELDPAMRAHFRRGRRWRTGLPTWVDYPQYKKLRKFGYSQEEAVDILDQQRWAEIRREIALEIRSEVAHGK